MQEIIDLLSDLVRLPSVNPMNRNIPSDIALEHRVAAYLEKHFHSLGVPVNKQFVAEGRENVIARHLNPSATKTVIWEVHMDTVPVDNMIIPPFEPKVVDGKLFGRGSCDVKGGMTAMLSAFNRLVKEKPPESCNVILACTVDEEHTFRGISTFAKSGIKADMAIVAEPTRLNIVNAHKGVTRWELTTLGQSCHSSTPDRGINAVYQMGKILTHIDRYAKELQQSRTDALLGPATLSVGTIRGGTSVNTVPDRCEIEIDRRLIPGEIPEETHRHFLNYLTQQPDIDFSFECKDPWMCMPALSPELSTDLAKILERTIAEVRGDVRIHSVPYGTDAPILAAEKIPTVIFGPGDIRQAHTKDEWIDLTEIATASEILFRFALSFENAPLN